MKFERIDALAAHVEALQHGRVAIGEPSVLEARGGPMAAPSRASCAACAAAPSRFTASCSASSVVNRL
jgi:hypothetical protein